MSARPHGDRVLCKIKIGKVEFYSRVKEGTQKLLGLTKVSGTIPKAKKNRARGWKGTLSYTLLLANQHTVGGHDGCVSVSLPVSPHCHLADVYAWAYKNAALAGIITPWGIKYAWKTAAKRSQKNLLQKGLDAVGGLLGDIEDIPGEVGDLVQGAENAIGNVGGYLQGVEGLAGDVITGAEQLGGYIAPFL